MYLQYNNIEIELENLCNVVATQKKATLFKEWLKKNTSI
ncbi:hypothetical protein L1275_003126 [Flavobacterium sp. HSC-61S13]|nr:hypothetical protein [Flavobacterium sp. HSC-61S13]